MEGSGEKVYFTHKHTHAILTCSHTHKHTHMYYTPYNLTYTQHKHPTNLLTHIYCKHVILTFAPRTKKVSVPGSVFAAVVGKNSCNLQLIKQATNTHIEIERTSKTASTRALSVRGSTEAIKQAQHIISQLVRDPSHSLANVLPRHLHASAAIPGQKLSVTSHDAASLHHSSLLGDSRVPLSSSLSLSTLHTSTITTRAAPVKKTTVPAAVAVSSFSRSSTAGTLPLSTRPGRTLGDKRHSAPQSVLASTELKGFAVGLVTTTQTRVASSVVSSAATVKFSVPLTPTSGAVRRLFATTAVHSGPTQTAVVVSVAQTTLPLLTLAPGGLVSSTQTSSGMAPPPPRIPQVSTAVGSHPYMPPVCKPLQTIPLSTNTTKTMPGHPDHYETTKTEPVASGTPSYSRAIGSHLTNPVTATLSLIEQPLQQIMKTPTIFQEPATQLTKPKKYSDAVGKKGVETATGKPLAAGTAAVGPSVPNPPLTHPTLSLPPSLPPTLLPSLPSSLTSSLPPSLTTPVLNLAPGTRPIITDDKVRVYSIYTLACVYYYYAYCE